jgi:glycosyltransferase involved in cell wall biosynthesis
LQALIYGAPVVSTDVGGLRELPGAEAICFVSEHRPESIARAIAGVIENIEEYRQKVLARFAREQFLSRRMIAEYLQVYQNC